MDDGTALFAREECSMWDPTWYMHKANEITQPIDCDEGVELTPMSEAQDKD